MIYDRFLNEAYENKLIVKEKPLQAYDGLIFNDRIAIRKDLETQCEKGCILAEELGHFHTSVGDILDYAVNSKQELKARGWAYDNTIGMDGLIRIKDCLTLEEAADTLDVTVWFLYEALIYFSDKYAPSIKHNGYIIQFIPNFEVRIA